MKFTILPVACALACALVFSSSPALAAKKAVAPKGPTVLTVVPKKTISNAAAPQGGTFYYRFEAEPLTINPITSTDLYSLYVRQLTMDRLLTMNVETHEWNPGLAERAELSEDGTAYTFFLRKDATFSDGKPVSAEDVKFSFDAIFDDAYAAAHFRPYFENFEKCEVVDPLTVRFIVKKKYFGNLEAVADTLWISPKHIYGDPKEGTKKNKSIVGSGPYVIEKYEQGQRITLARNKAWWGNSLDWLKGENNFDKIVIRFAKEDLVALEMLKKGDLDYLRRIAPESYVKNAVGPEWGTKVLKLQVENKEPKSYGYIGWNQTNDLFKSRDVRLALQLLMNRDEMNKKFRYEMSLPATGPWYQQSEYADPKRKAIPFDPKKAAQLLAKSGWKDSDNDGVLDKIIDGKKVDFSFTLIHGNKDSEKYMTLYQQDLRKAGVKMEIQLLEWNALLKQVHEHTFQAAALAWGAGSVDLDPKQIWHSTSSVKGGSNYVSYSNPEVDKLIDEAREELDKGKRIKILRKVYNLIADDAPYAFLFNDRYWLYARTARLGVVNDTFTYGVDFQSWWIQP